LLRTALKGFPQHSNNPIVSSVLFPLLSFLPAIFQVFFGLLTSFLHLGHFAISFTVQIVRLIKDKTLSVVEVLESLLKSGEKTIEAHLSVTAMELI